MDRLAYTARCDRRPLFRGRSLASRAVLLFGLALGGGCGYTVGHQFPAEVRSIYVPIFSTQTDRRGLEFQLTEAVIKQLQLRTPLRIVKEPFADSKLTGKILDVKKNVLGETQFDDPRELQLNFIVSVSWENLRDGSVIAEQEFSLTKQEVLFVSQAEFAPEVGQSYATAVAQVVDRIARDVVNMMEVPW